MYLSPSLSLKSITLHVSPTCSHWGFLQINPEAAREEFRAATSSESGGGVKDFMDSMGLGGWLEQVRRLGSIAGKLPVVTTMTAEARSHRHSRPTRKDANTRHGAGRIAGVAKERRVDCHW